MFYRLGKLYNGILARLCSKSFKQGFNRIWTRNFQVYKLDFKKAEEPEIKFPTSICWIIEKAREFQKNIYFCFIDYTNTFNCVDHNKPWKILQEMGIPDHLTCLLKNLYADQEAIVRSGHGIANWFQIGKRVCQGCLSSPCLFNLYAVYIIQNGGLDEAQAEVKISGKNVNNFRYADDTTLMAERSKEPL